MPALNAGDLAQIRSRPIGRRFQLFVFQPASWWTGVVAGAPSRGDRELEVTTSTGAIANMYANCTIRVTDSAGNPKDYPSKVRYRTTDAGPPVTITVGDNAVDWAVGDLLTGQRLFELWPRHLYVDAADPANPVQYKDRDIAWVDDDYQHRPKANAGPAAIGKLVGGQCDLVFTDGGSYSPPADGAIAAYQWTALGGTPAVVAGGAATATVTYRYTAAGYYYVTLEVEDANGEVNRIFVPVIVDDGTMAATYEHPGDRRWDSVGWVLSRELRGLDSDPSFFYDGAPVFLVADDRQVATSAFVANRKNLRWAGWLMEDQTDRAGRYGRTVRYRAVSSAHVLMTIPAYPLGLRYSASPAEWDHSAIAWNMDTAVTHMLEWHSTVNRTVDVLPTGEWATRLIGEKDIAESNSLIQQLEWLLSGVVGNLRCDQQGRLHMMRSEWFLSAAEEAARATVMTLTNQDWQRARYGPRQHRARVREFRGGGVDGAGNPYLSGAPGSAPLDGGRPDEKLDLNPNDQPELNQWTAQFLSVKNWDFPLVLQMSGEYDVFDPALGEYVAGDLGDYDDKLQDGPYSVTGVRFTDNSRDGYSISEITLLPDPSAYGAYGSETEEVPEQGEPPPDDEPPDDEPVWEEPPRGWPEICIYPTRLDGVWYSIDFTGTDSVTMPTWTQVGTGGTWPGDDGLLDFATDTDDPFSNMYALTTTARDLIKWTGATWTTVLAAADYQDPVDPLYCGHASGTLTSIWVDIDNDTLWAVAIRTTTGSGLITAYKSIDGGSSWSVYNVVGPGELHMKHNTNIMAYDDRVAVMHNSGPGGSTAKPWYSINAGGAWTNGTNDIHLDAGAYVQRVFVPEHTSEFLMRGINTDGDPNVWSNAWAVLSVEENVDYLWDFNERDSPLKMWGSPDDVGHYRLIRNNSLRTTLNSFAAYTNHGQLEIPGYNDGSTPVDVAGMAYRVAPSDLDMIVYFTQDPNANFPHCIFAAYTESDLTPEQKSGADPVTPDGSSIPVSGGGACRGGPKLFYADDITLP